jgi:hypothetical protein
MIRERFNSQPNDPATDQSQPCACCTGAGFVTFREGIPEVTRDVQFEEHLIGECPECSGSGVVKS